MTTSLSPWTAGFGVLDPFRKEMEGLMERFFGGSHGNGKPGVLKAWAPRVDVEETDKEIVVKADLPGVDPKAVEVSVENGTLTVRGEHKEEREEKKKTYHLLERFSGSFSRRISLPPSADADKMTATSANGVVTVTIPKKFEAQPKTVPVTPRA